MTTLLVLAGLVSAAGRADAQHRSGPLAPPPGNVPFLTLHANGTQDYVCLPGNAGPGEWVFERPEAELVRRDDPRAPAEMAEHALVAVPGSARMADPACSEAGDGSREYCPSWRSPLDRSAVWGAKVASETAGSGADCPNGGAVACLLLRAVATTGAREGRGPGLFGAVTFVQRLHTVGGAPPTGSCRAGQIEQVPYRADYSFFRRR